MKYKIQIFSASISLLALLSYTFVHTGGLLARYIKPEVVGYIAAIGIELSIVSLSLRISDMRKLKQPNGFFLFVLIAVVAVSAVANVAEGFYVSMGTQLTSETFGQLDTIQATIGLMATAIISLIVFALSEIAGNDVSAIIKKAEREQKKLESSHAATNRTSDMTSSVSDMSVTADTQLATEVEQLVPQVTQLVNDEKLVTEFVFPSDFRLLTSEQLDKITYLTSEQLVSMADISDSTASRWIRKAKSISNK